MRGLSLPLRLYIFLVVALGAGLTGLALVIYPLGLSPLTAALAVALAGLVALAGAYPMPMSAKVKANVTTAPLFIAVLLLSPALAAITATLGVLVSGLFLKRKAHHLVFNTAATSVYVGGGALLLAALKPGSFYGSSYGVASAIVAGITVYVLNRAVVAVAASMESRNNPVKLWLRTWRNDVAQELALMSLGIAGAVAVDIAPWSLAFLLLPVVVMYNAFSKVVALSSQLEVQMEQLKAAEAQLVQTAKMASLGTLAAGMGHQINNPAFVIRGRAELLLDGADRHLKTDKAKQHIEVIRDMGDRISRIVKCLLTSSRPSEDGSTCTDVNDALDRMALLLEDKLARSQVEVVRDYEADVPLVPGDPVEIQEMLGNLMTNACDAMSRGGHLRLKTRSMQDSVVIEIADTGTGISQYNIARIFDPFFTTKGEGNGMGLGLFVVKNIAQKHGGSVQVESQLGEGTMFSITLPMADGRAQKDARGQKPGEPATLAVGSGSRLP